MPPQTMSLTPRELLGKLRGIFPEYAFEQAVEVDSTDFTHHGLLIDFADFYGAGSTSFSERQVKDLAGLINAAVDAGGDLENAFATCFLEHLGQMKARKPLVSFLSDNARLRLHA